MRLDRQGWAAVAAASRAVSERALTEREACIEVWARTGRAPREVVRTIRAAVKLFEGRARGPRPAATLTPPTLRRTRARASR